MTLCHNGLIKTHKNIVNALARYIGKYVKNMNK